MDHVETIENAFVDNRVASTSGETFRDNDINTNVDREHASDGVTKIQEQQTFRNEIHTPVDLRLLEFVSEVDHNLICPICHCPFIEPVRLRCDHTFCVHCVGRAIRNQTQDVKTCPTCRSPTIGVDALPVPRFFIHLIDDLKVRCPRYSFGCEIQMRRSDAQAHVDHYCDFADVACSSEYCTEKVARKDLTSECLHRIVSCECCGIQLMKSQLQNHLEKHCSKRKTQCPNCNEDLAQPDLIEHQNECPEAQILCKSSHIGCQFISSRADTLQHESNCLLVRILPTMQAMQRCIEDQGAALKLLQRRNDELATGLFAMQALLGETPIGENNFPSEVQPSSSTAALLSTATSFTASTSPPFDSATHHLLSLHESLREEVDRVVSAVSTLDARTSMMIMNESLRIKEDMAHTNAAIGSMRMQLQWLTSARLQAQRNTLSPPALTDVSLQGNGRLNGTSMPDPIRRLSESNKQELKL